MLIRWNRTILEGYDEDTSNYFLAVGCSGFLFSQFIRAYAFISALFNDAAFVRYHFMHALDIE